MTLTHPADILALAILNQDRIDWQLERPKGNLDSNLINFYNSDWFEDLCFLVGHHPDQIRRQLEIPSYSKQD